MFSEKNGWCVPIMTMEETLRSKKSNKNDKRWGKKQNIFTVMYYCKCCNRIFQKKLYGARRFNNSKNEYYSVDVIPKYGLEKKECEECK